MRKLGLDIKAHEQNSHIPRGKFRASGVGIKNTKRGDELARSLKIQFFEDIDSTITDWTYETDADGPSRRN